MLVLNLNESMLHAIPTYIVCLIYWHVQPTYPRHNFVWFLGILVYRTNYDPQDKIPQLVHGRTIPTTLVVGFRGPTDVIVGRVMHFRVLLLTIMHGSCLSA